ncbi:MAG: S-layer homology domain-containing protein [Clostridia bacterium]|nr:S-layer homology domain-containing protein [Clostridia bacterium]
MKKNVLFSFCFLLVVIVASSAAAFAADASDESLPVSHGLYVLAEENSMAMAGIKGNKISFDADDFARSLNLSEVTSVTVTEVPPTADGELLVGSTVVNAGQTISGSNIALISYNAKSDTSTMSYFRFKAGDSAYDIRCNLYMLDKVNHAPTLSTATETSLNVSTHKNITLYGTLPAHDPDGDEIMIEIVSYPSSGILVMTDKASGSYTYTPSDDYTGKDSFTYVARDKYGNYSASKTVNLTVNKLSTSVVYNDMTSSPFYNAALTMTEEGIMSGTQVGGNTYFYPEKTVSRSEFLVMAMNTLGITEVSDSATTVFSDDGDIPGYTKGYIATAYELGFIKGTYVDSELCFLPNDPITRAEAAVIVCNMVDIAAPTVTPTFNDSDEIPAFAESAVCSLNYMGILSSSDGNISANAELTRGEAAHILSLVMQIAED